MVGAKHSGSKYRVPTNQLDAGMLRPLLYNGTNPSIARSYWASALRTPRSRKQFIDR